MLIVTSDSITGKNFEIFFRHHAECSRSHGIRNRG